jgi:hypothetical protein
MFMKSCVLEVLLSRKTLNVKFIIIVLEMCQECKVMFGSLVVSLTSMCQIGKALLNYTLIGSTVTPFIHMLMDAVKKVPDPGNVLSLMDLKKFYGLCGLKYNLWQAVQTNALVHTSFIVE